VSDTCCQGRYNNGSSNFPLKTDAKEQKKPPWLTDGKNCSVKRTTITRSQRKVEALLDSLNRDHSRSGAIDVLLSKRSTSHLRDTPGLSS
jgi:hypothetical protein